jgi:hypothetical protein
MQQANSVAETADSNSSGRCPTVIRLQRILAGMSRDPSFASNPMAPVAFSMLALWIDGAADDEVVHAVTTLRDTLNVVVDG